jgi:NADPH:quinone reductase-like Zn-dependent oxidoreductase
MRAVTLTAVGGPEVLDVRDARTPEPGSGEGVNRADLLVLTWQ